MECIVSLCGIGLLDLTMMSTSVQCALPHHNVSSIFVTVVMRD